MKVIMDDDAIFVKAHEEYTSFTRDDRMREIYEAREKALKDYNSGIKYGKKLGREQGIEQGIEQGMKQNSKENARRMLADNVPIQAIAKYTGLSIAEIEALRDEQG